MIKYGVFVEIHVAVTFFADSVGQKEDAVVARVMIAMLGEDVQVVLGVLVMEQRQAERGDVIRARIAAAELGRRGGGRVAEGDVRKDNMRAAAQCFMSLTYVFGRANT